MSDDQENYSEWTPAALLEELAARETYRVDLSKAADAAGSQEQRVVLLTRLSANGDAIDKIRAELMHRSKPSPDLAIHRSVVVTNDHQRSQNPRPTTNRAGQSDDGRSFAEQPQYAEQPQFTDQSQYGERRNAMREDRPFWQGMLLGIALLAGVGLAALFVIRATDDASTETADPASPEVESVAASEISAFIEALGAQDVRVEQIGSTIFVMGSISTTEMYEAIVGGAGSLAGEIPVDASGLILSTSETDTTPTSIGPVGQADALQADIARIIAATPIIFQSGVTEITELHQRVLNNVAATINAYPGLAVSVVGYTDDVGSEEENRQLSLTRAESVRSYLISKGVPENALSIEAVGEQDATGSEQLANLERRVEFKVAGGAALEGTGALRIALVAPSDRGDLAFTQSMADAIGVIQAERGGIEVEITDNTFVPDEAAAAIRQFADEGYDLIIAHGSQYGPSILEIAPQYPSVVFGWGTASDTFGLPNVFAYDAAAEEGGYVLGALSALLSESGTIGVVGPIEVGDAERYVNGFRAGAVAENPATNVLVTYTGSFSDTAFARDAALAHVDNGADVLTGSAQMVLGAVNVVIENDLLWFGTQANQSPLAPDLVGASQVYHWEVILRQIIAEIDSGTVAGKAYSANLENGGLAIEFNASVELEASVRQRADELTAQIAAGDIVIPG